GPHVLFLPATERRRVLHAALLTLPAVDVGPQQAVADRERLADRVLARPRTERDHGAHHLVAQHDRQLRGRQRLSHPGPLMHVRTADQRDVDAHEQGTRLELVLARHRQLADLDRLAVFGHDGGAGGLRQAHAGSIPMFAISEAIRYDDGMSDPILECKHGLKHGCAYCHVTRPAGGPAAPAPPRTNTPPPSPAVPGKKTRRGSSLSEKMNDRMTALKRRLREIRGE